MIPSRTAYDTDLTYAEWEQLIPLVPPTKAGGRPPKHSRREILNGIFYAVRSGGAWKYVLGLELTDPGFDASVLVEFRARLVAHEQTQLLFETLLAQLQAAGLVKARGRQRTDSTRVLAAVQDRNRLECVWEAMRWALHSLAQADPDWLRAVAPAPWYERYIRSPDRHGLVGSAALLIPLANSARQRGAASAP